MAVPDLAKLHALSWTVHSALEEVGVFCSMMPGMVPKPRAASVVRPPLQMKTSQLGHRRPSLFPLTRHLSRSSLRG